MQTLVFNTTNRTVVLYASSRDEGKIIERFDDVPTVKINQNFYEIMMKVNESVIPVMRTPISNTNMIILK